MPEKTFTEKQLKYFVIKLRKKHDEIEQQQFFCSKHNFNLEKEAKRNEAEVIKRIIYDMETDFELGHVSVNSFD